MHFFTAVLAATTTAKEISCSDASGIPFIGGTVAGACKTAVGAANSVDNTVSSVGDIGKALSTILGYFMEFFTHFVQFVHDFFFWFLNLFFPTELQTWFFGTLGLEPLHGGAILGLNANDPNDPYHNMFAVMVAPGLAVAACASGARIVRTLLDQRATSMNVVVDVLVRFVVVAAVLVPVGGVSFGYLAMAWAYNAVQLFSLDIGLHLLGAAMFKGAPAGSSVMEKIWFGFMNTPSAGATLALGILFWLIFVLYAVIMMFIRAILIGFCVAMAPLCVATAAFDNRNKFFTWWLDIFTGTLAIAPILTLAFWISFTLASSVLVGLVVVGPIIAIIIMIGSIWMAGKLIHQLTWKHFSHGGAIGAFGAAFGVMALTGKGAQTLGLVPALANHPKIGPALDLVKQMGYTAQGFNPEARGVPHGSVVDDKTAAKALGGKNAGTHGSVVGHDSVPSPAGALREAGTEIGEEEDQALGTGVADLVSTPAFAGILGEQLSGDKEISNATARSATTAERAQLYWDSLSRSPGGGAVQLQLAKQAYSHLLGSGGLAPGGAAGGGGGGGGGTAGAGGLTQRAAATSAAVKAVRSAAQASGFGGGTPPETSGFFPADEESS